MKKKIFMLLAMVMTVMTASAYSLTVGTSEKGSVAFEVDNQTVTAAEAGATVTVKITPEPGYAACAITAEAIGEWGAAKARKRGAAAIDLLNVVETVKVKTNEYTFVMPTADVEVSVEYEYSAPVASEENKEGGKAVDNVSVKMDIMEGTTPVEEDGVTVVQVVITGIDVPTQTDASATDKKEITVEIPAEMYSADGKIKFVVTKIAADAFKTPEESNTVVTKVVLPETDDVIPIEEGAMSPNGEPIAVVVPLTMLDDYALQNSLKPNFEAQKISAIANPANMYWSFSSGVDVVLPEGVKAFTCFIPNGVEVQITEIPEEKLLVDGQRVILANNGVLLANDSEKGGTFEMVANPGHQLSGTKPATTDAKSYGERNWLEPVIEATHYAAGEYLVLKDNEFHEIEADDSKTPACKAILHKKTINN